MRKYTTLFCIFSCISTQVWAANVNIVCTYRGSYDKDGYEELMPTSFTVSITEDGYGNAKSASLSEGHLCSYTSISEYSNSTIMFSGCKRPEWLAADKATPEGFFKIDRYTGEFTQSIEFPSSQNSLSVYVGDCRAGQRKF